MPSELAWINVARIKIQLQVWKTQVDHDVEMTPSQPLRENDCHYTRIAQTKLTRIAQTKLAMSLRDMLMAAVCVCCCFSMQV